MSEAKCYHLEVELILHPLPGEAMKKDAIICVSRSSVIRRLHKRGGGDPLTPYFSLHW